MIYKAVGCLPLIDTSAADISLYYFDFINIFGRNIQYIVAQHGKICMIPGLQYSCIRKPAASAAPFVYNFTAVAMSTA